MQKRFFKQKRMYIAIIFVLCFSALTSYSVYSDICANAVEVSKNKLSDNASLFTSYYNDMINEKIGNLEQLAGEIKLSNLQDKGKMEKLVAKYAELTDDEINWYIDHYKPFDKAGAYGIQEWIGYIGIRSVEGSYFNVMGLPVDRVRDAILDFEGRN